MFFESFLLNLAVLLVLIVALTFDYVTKFFSYWYIREIPNKTPVPFFGTDYHRILGLRNTTEEINKLYNENAKEKYVGCIKSRIPDLIIKDPDSVQKVLSTDFSNFHCRGYGLARSRDVCLRNNLFYAEGEKWTLLRIKFELLLNTMDDKIEDSLHDCLSGTNGDANVQQLLSGILDVVFKDLLIDNNLDDPFVIKKLRETMQRRTLFDKLKSYLKDIFPSIYVMLGLNILPEQYFSKYARVIKESKLMKDIEKTDSISQEDIHNDKPYKKGSDLETAYSYLALFIGQGYIPCHYVLTALLFELAKNPDVQQKARNCLQNSEENHYLDMTLKEALRLYPAYSIITRKCVKTYTFPGKTLHLDKGVTISVPVEAIQRDEKYYENANEFNPDRFSNKDDDTKLSYLPFGAGPRKCVGEQLALRIIRTVAASILKKYQIGKCDVTPKTLKLTDHDFLRVVDNDLWLRFKPIS
ncbi:cytochrome P450 6B1-like [Maniola hyperantus]|uniref:cytochrome P450 6B1-like n=1 Tax=Aphantopus hyperantus TaxID=2795564 RepID=UPI001569F16A|nr:cytochrome P450 6B1-like [Maniola hyperantus]